MGIGRPLRVVASAIVPGLGQLIAGRFADGALLLFAMLWMRGFLAGHAPDGRVSAFLFGAPAIEGGLRQPTVVVFTALLLGLHVLAAWTAGLNRKGEVG